MIEQAAAVALALFMAGVIYHSGRLSARVEHLERWREEVRREFNQMFAVLRRIERAVLREEE